MREALLLIADGISILGLSALVIAVEAGYGRKLPLIGAWIARGDDH